MASHDVTLKVGGQIYAGWKSITIRRSMEQLASTFELGLTDRWNGSSVARPIKPGLACSVLIDGKTIITGHIDDAEPSYDGAAHGITVSGRDLTGDLVDCSAPSTQFADRTLLQVAKDLCKPFGVGVKAETDVGGVFSTLKNNEGDSIFDTLESAARVRAVLLMSDGLGNLLLTKAGTDRVSTRLALGENIVTASARFSNRDRFSSYTVKGQSAGGDDWNAEDAAHPLATATDTGVSRHRPLTVLAEENIDQAAAQKRADWECNVRFGRSRRVQYRVAGWTHADGLWTPNRLVRVKDAYLAVDQELLIAGAALTLDGKGWWTDLDLLPREAFLRAALPEPEDATW
ncbi:phage baseplate assembly protein [Pseudodesulfovibrio indicus]|uniref:Prophage tail gpP-like protein n=1 Tax=Pseudodesulfovibrio indicus TaxID=1716143 RepID=A0A140D8Y8_9BACT|nr:hypothetical protein [Pseudodesulfovibrio indicus]AMK09655.1 hypothetical protein AWY79_00295 [Pseudodesulfovibrio indicus]TDT86393.1 prophage tail gpP-like protein [Pseudodesulfovibrio indicus]